MCSIFGYVARADAGPKFSALQSIVRANITRGPHAFGLAWLDRQGRLRMYKQTGRLTDHLGVLALAREARMMVGHLRYATHGSADDQINNHPHPADGGWLVHNGIVQNYRDLVVGRRLWPVSECDSEVLGQLLERLPGTLLQRSAATVEATRGPLAMLGLWSRPGAMIVARRGNPLHVGETSTGFYLGSLALGLPGLVRAVPDNRAIRFAVGGARRQSVKIDGPTFARASLFDAATYTGG